MGFDKELKRIRSNQGITQKALAEKLCTTPQNINQYETGKRNPSHAMIEKIAEALNVNYMYSSNGELHFYTGDRPVIDDPIVENSLENDLLKMYRNFNDKGKEQALNQLKLLSKIPEFIND